MVDSPKIRTIAIYSSNRQSGSPSDFIINSPYYVDLSKYRRVNLKSALIPAPSTSPIPTLQENLNLFINTIGAGVLMAPGTTSTFIIPPKIDSLTSSLFSCANDTFSQTIDLDDLKQGSSLFPMNVQLTQQSGATTWTSLDWLFVIELSN
jgi:hypothetical protein